MCCPDYITLHYITVFSAGPTTTRTGPIIDHLLFFTITIITLARQRDRTCGQLIKFETKVSLLRFCLVFCFALLCLFQIFSFNLPVTLEAFSWRLVSIVLILSKTCNEANSKIFVPLFT